MILKTVRNPHIQSRKSNRNAVMLCVSDFVWTRTKNKEKSRFEHEPRYIRMLTTDHWSTEIKLSLGQCQSLTSFIDHSVIMQSLLLQLSERRSNCILFFFVVFLTPCTFITTIIIKKSLQKCHFAGSSFLIIMICSVSLSFMIVSDSGMDCFMDGHIYIKFRATNCEK